MNISIKSKEYYSLMWEYLKRSEKYKTFCNTFARMDPMQVLASDELTDFTKKHKIKLVVFFNYFTVFGNIHQRDFNDWWKENRQQLEPNKLIVSDLSTGLSPIHPSDRRNVLE